jgi:hypothetical protein
VAQQLDAQLDPALVALRQELQRAPLQRQPGARPGHAALRGTISP